MLGAWPLLLESGQASQSALRLHAHFPDGFAARDWLEQNRDKTLERAIQTLDNLDYIGICEDFDNSVRELFEILRLPLSDVVPHFNQRERYPDEADPGAMDPAKPLTELDAEIYAEACRRHGSHRNRRVNRADFLKRTVAAGEDQIFDANAQPGGHGWHYPQLRHDGLPSRWTGPGSRSSVYFGTAAAGRYCFQLYAFGAVSPESLLAMMIWINNQIIPARAEELPQGEWQVTANFSQETEGPLDIELFVPIVIDGVGVEVRGWRIKSLDPPATAITSVDENVCLHS